MEINNNNSNDIYNIIGHIHRNGEGSEEGLGRGCHSSRLQKERVEEFETRCEYVRVRGREDHVGHAHKWQCSRDGAVIDDGEDEEEAAERGKERVGAVGLQPKKS